MSTGSVRRRNGKWQARYRGLDNQERSKTFARKLDADRWLASESASKIEGRWIDPKSSRVTIGEFAEDWLASRSNRPTTIETYRSHLRNHFLPAMGDRPIGSIRPTELEGWLGQLGQRLAPATVETVWRVVVSVFKAAKRDRLIAHSPTDDIHPPRPERRVVVPLEVSEVLALIDAAPERYRALVALAAGSGLRQGETFGVTASSLNMLRREVVVDRQIVQVGTRPQWGPPKTDASVRTVPLANVTLERLAEHISRFPSGPDGVLFTNAEGRWIRRSAFSVSWKRTVARAGLDRERVRFHELRHHYASVLIAAGSSVKVVQGRLGHSSAAETLDTYSHMWPDDADQTRAAIEEAMTGS